jgi:hypothetical protein
MYSGFLIGRWAFRGLNLMRPLGFSGHLLVRGLLWYSPAVNQTSCINRGRSAKVEYNIRVYLHHVSGIQSWMSSHRESLRSQAWSGGASRARGLRSARIAVFQGS